MILPVCRIHTPIHWFIDTMFKAFPCSTATETDFQYADITQKTAIITYPHKP